jgi:hypothetical protein
MATNSEKTELEIIAEKERISSIARNEYTFNNGYNSNNVNALSNGDEKGKGELDGQVGSLTDINTRKDNMGRNVYNGNNGYGINNPNALSDGDEKGKGELNGQIGSATDINIRKDNLGRNEKYGPNKKSYPDFVI